MSLSTLEAQLAAMAERMERAEASARGAASVAGELREQLNGNGKPQVAAPTGETATAPNGKGKARKAATAPNGAGYSAQIAFTHQAIKVLRRAEGNRSKGIHTVISGFNGAFRLQFPAIDVVAATKGMVERGDLQSHFARMGAMLYLPGEMPQAKPRDNGAAALTRIMAG